MEVGHAVSKRFDVQLSRAECLIDGCRHLGHLCEVATTNTAVQIEDLPTQCLATKNTLPLKYWLGASRT